jgi:site-specific recombinase XerD
MKLFTTDSSYVVAGIGRPGIPFLCDQDMELVEAPNRYLDHVAVVRGRTKSAQTWKTYGEHLYDFFSFLEDNGLSWSEADERTLAAWRDGMAERGNQVRTINGRLRGVHRFYSWAVHAGLLSRTPFTMEEVMVSKPSGFLAHVSANAGRALVNEITLREPRRLPRYLQIEQATQFLDSLTPRRMRLMGYTMLLTGMRRDEVAGLDHRVLPNPAGQPTDKALDMVLDPSKTPTKGSTERTVKVPYLLGVALYDYFTWERPQLERLHEAKWGRPTTRLFLSRHGEELSTPGISVAFHEASQKCGIKCAPHMLRHTFGTYEFTRMNVKWGKDRALYWVRDRLGHSSITQTEVYVHLSDNLTNDVVDGYVADVCKALVHGA